MRFRFISIRSRNNSTTSRKHESLSNTIDDIEIPLAILLESETLFSRALLAGRGEITAGF